MTMQQAYKYFAFISYNSRDTEWGKRLQRKLEHYRMPATLCSEHGWSRTPIKPVFFAPTDIQPGELTEELQERLRASRNLIVICSPNSAKSEWVGKEIEFFYKLGRTKQIHFFIVDGTPHSGNPDTECINPIVKTLGLPEILGANIHERIYRWPWMNKERAYVQLISKLLGVEFDAIWQRHRRLLVRKAMLWATGALCTLAAILGVWVQSQPFDVEVRLNESSIPNSYLPPLRHAVVTMSLDNETKSDTIALLSDAVVFTNVPHRFLGKEVRVEVTARNFLPIDTIVELDEQLSIGIRRNPTVYGDVHFRLWDSERELFVGGVTIGLEGQATISDNQGWIRFTVPLASQKTCYDLTSSIPLEKSRITMPCGPNDVIMIKSTK